MPNRKLCLVVPEFRTEVGRSGGLDGVAQFLLNTFSSRRGWEVSVASVRMSHKAPQHRRILSPTTWLRGPSSACREIDGLRIVDFGAHVGEVEPIRYLPNRILDRYLSAFDLAIVVCGSPAIATVLSRTRVPVIAQVATLIEEERSALIARSRMPEKLWRIAVTHLTSLLDDHGLKVPDVVFVENPHMLEECRRRRVKDVRLVPPGVDTVRFHPVDFEQKEDFILSVGRFNDPRKDIRTLILSYSHAVKSGVTSRLILAGLEGPSGHVMALIEELGLKELIDIRVNVPIDELAELYQKASLFALSSTEEGLGLVFLESMASGTPFVATATEGARYVHGNEPVGELIEFGSSLSTRFGSAIHRWMADENRRREAGEAAAERANRVFSESATGRLFLEAADQICK